MSDKFDSGFSRAFLETVGGLITPIIISSFVSTSLFPSYFIWLFHILSIVDIISLIKATSFWATSYIIGWLIGVIIFASAGLLTILDILIYLIPLGFLFARFARWWRGG